MPSGGKRTGAGRPKGSSRYGTATKAVRVPEHLVNEILRFAQHGEVAHGLPLYSSSVKAGHPTAADDCIETQLDLSHYLVKHPAATFVVRASGESMIQAGIFDQDLLIVDRTIEPTSGKIVVAALNGELTVKRLQKSAQECFLVAENPDFAPIVINASDSLHIWGVVIHIIRSL